jgi:hypothetical protein
MIDKEVLACSLRMLERTKIFLQKKRDCERAAALTHDVNNVLGGGRALLGDDELPVERWRAHAAAIVERSRELVAKTRSYAGGEASGYLVVETPLPYRDTVEMSTEDIRRAIGEMEVGATEPPPSVRAVIVEAQRRGDR